MMRFINLGRQIDEDVHAFAFFNTVTEQFVRVDDGQVFESVSAFQEAAQYAPDIDAVRLLRLIPPNWPQE